VNLSPPALRLVAFQGITIDARAGSAERILVRPRKHQLWELETAGSNPARCATSLTRDGRIPNAKGGDFHMDIAHEVLNAVLTARTSVVQPGQFVVGAPALRNPAGAPALAAVPPAVPPSVPTGPVGAPALAAVPPTAPAGPVGAPALAAVPPTAPTGPVGAPALAAVPPAVPPNPAGVRALAAVPPIPAGVPATPVA
jgi:hypothetical protein